MIEDRPLPPVTILMACYHGAAHLPAQLDSIAAQEGVDWRLVASDDAATKGETWQVLEQFRARFPDRVLLRKGPGRGATAHFMDLLLHAPIPADHAVALSDQDDIWDRDKLKQALIHLDPLWDRPAAYSARSRHMDARGRLLGLSRPYPGGCSLANALVENRVSGHAAVLTPAALQRLRDIGPVPAPYHDWWLYLALMATGGEVICDPSPRLTYRQHGGNVVGAPRGALALLRRLALVLGPQGPQIQRANHRALALAAPWWTPETQQLLSALEAAPKAGWPRARALRALGVQRHSRAADLVVGLAACLGRI